ncbi:MAG: hypothetical protein IIW48_04505 [Clostridia bacterium]|nr:hypothetical protein [Clostridia bacterium]
MVGLGKWACTVDSMLYRGEVTVNILEKDGKYDFELELPGVDIPEYTIKSIDVTEDSLSAVVSIAMLGKDAQLDINFEEDSFSGIIKLPLIGKIKLKDGHKI